MGNKRSIKLKNYLVITIIFLIGLIILSLLNYTGYAITDVDMRILIPEESKEVALNSEITANLLISNIKEPTNISIRYSANKIGLTDSVSKQFNQLIYTEEIIPLTLTIPEDSEPGIYQLKVINMNNNQSTVEIFQVRENETSILGMIIRILSFLLVLAIITTSLIFIHKNWKWFKDIKLNSTQIIWSLKWKLKQNNYYLKYLYMAIAALIMLILLIIIIF